MSNTYGIDKERLPEHLLEVIQAIQQILGAKAYDFILVGAAARDLILDGLHGRGIKRGTKDIDFALYIPAWETYTEIINALVESEHFARTDIQHKLIYKMAYEVDIVPFGGIQDEEGRYLWPPEGLKSMTVIGFEQIKDGSIQIRLPDSEIAFQVASIPGMCAMKLLAWRERKYEDDRDGKDLGFLLSQYWAIRQEADYAEIMDILDDPLFDTDTAGARIMGRDVAFLLKDNPKAIEELISILDDEIVREDSSLLPAAMRYGGMVKFEIAFNALKELRKGLREKDVH